MRRQTNNRSAINQSILTAVGLAWLKVNHKDQQRQQSLLTNYFIAKSITMFKLQFPIRDLDKYAREFTWNEKLEPIIVNEIVPSVRKNGFLSREEFLIVCNWKSPRISKHCKANDEATIRELSRLALATPNERLRIELLTLLNGVQYPVASVFLHFFHRDKYPIIDWRALASLGIKRKDIDYNFDFWFEYVKYCRGLSEKTGKSMRYVDQALWQYAVYIN